MTMKTNISRLLNYLDELFPSVGCELLYTKDYELVIAVMLSAQTTDKSVNAVTPILFKKYPDLDSLNNAPLEDIENVIKQIGLYKNKAKNLKGIVKDLLTKSKNHHRGIKVRLEDGQVGRVQKILKKCQ